MYQNDLFFYRPKKDTVLGRALDAPRMNELCFISEYIYQAIIFEDVYPELQKRYNELAMDDMVHYRLLSELQYKLGVNPTVNLKLSTKAINICEDRDSIAPRAALRSLRTFILQERASAQEYRKLSEKTDDVSISGLLLNFANDKERHADLLSELESTIITN